MDISDILSSVTRAHNAANGAPADDNTEKQQDLELLTKAWVSERVAPELLPYPAELMDRVMNRLRRQIELIEDKTSSMDAGTSFTLVVLQTELERYKFLIRSFLRSRIAKIDAHTAHLLSQHRDRPLSSTLDPTNPLMSPSEAQYAEMHAGLLERHYQTSFLAAFPPKLTRLDDRSGAGGVGMVEGPDLDKAVFVRCIGRQRDPTQRSNGQDEGLDNEDEDGDDDHDMDEARNAYAPVEISGGFPSAPSSSTRERVATQDEGSRTAERRIRMRRGEIWIVRWSSVREAVASGECELI